MNSQIVPIIQSLESQKSIRALFVLLNIFAWIADDNLEKNITGKYENSINTSKYIYIVITAISLIVNTYFLYVSIKQNNRRNSNNQKQLQSSAYTLIVIALVILLYLQLTGDLISMEELD